MKTLEAFISPFIADQLPAIYREEGPLFVAFIKAYFEWLESPDNPIYDARRLLEYRDIDKTIDGFVEQFKTKYMFPIPKDITGDKRLLQKHIKEIYGSKGTERGLKLLFQLLFGDSITVYKPGDDLLRLSDGDWSSDVYLEVSNSPYNSLFVNEFVRGRNSSATAYVKGFRTKYINNKHINVFYLTNIRGLFLNDEVVIIDTSKLPSGESPAVSAINSPKIIGSLTSIDVSNRSTPFGYSIGDELEVQGGNGKGGKVVVTGLKELDGTVSFYLEDGGSGYTTTSTEFKLFGPATNVLVVNGGSGYSNSDFLVFSNGTGSNGISNIVTSGAGVILNNNAIGESLFNITNGGNGFLTTSNSCVITVANSTGGASAGSSAVLVIEVAGGGDSANLRVGSITDVKTIWGSALKINAMGNTLTYIGVANGASNTIIGTLPRPDANGYGLSANVNAGFYTILRDALGYQNYTVGTIDKIFTINPGQDYTTNLQVTVVDTIISEMKLLDTTSEAGRGTEGSGYLGNNAIITADAGFGDDALGSVKVIDSGFGYEQRAEVTLASLSNTSLVASGTVELINQGNGEGGFKSTKGFLSSDKFIQDSYYYQDYSYEVRSSIVFSKYSDLLKKLWHPAGVEKFGRVLISTEQTVVEPDITVSSHLGEEDVTTFAIPGGV